MEVGFVHIPDWILAVSLILIGLYTFFTWHYGFFKSRGIPGPPPRLVTGNLLALIEKGTIGSAMENIKKYGKVYGVFEGRIPVYSIADVNILRQILVKQFPLFVGRRKFLFVGLLGNSVFHCPARNWKRIRSLLTPAFTTGKIRQMETAINKNIDRLVDNFDRYADDAKSVTDVKNYTGGYTMDVIASTAFGLDVDSQNNKDDPFVKFASKLLDLPLNSFIVYIAVYLNFMVPLLEATGLTYMTKSYFKFFNDIVQKAAEQRKNENVKRVDLLSLILNAHSQMEDQEVKDDLQMAGLTGVRETKGLSDDELVANCSLIFSAGYDTTANTLAFLMYNLALNPDVQEKAHDEVTKVMEGHDSPNYDIVNKLPYLDMCISETLRIFPIIPSVDRRASQDVTIDGIFFPKDIVVSIPIYALHFDPDVWPEPEKFDPERFSPAAKAARDQFSYMPFGLGPRQCLGMRLAQLEMKMAMVNVLRKFRFKPTSETQIPMKLKVGIFVEPEKPISLHIERR